MMHASNDYERLKQQALKLDLDDPLAHCLKAFSLPQGCVYLDGNSLGPLPLTAQTRAKEVVEVQWGQDLITSWNKHQWIDLPRQVGKKIAPLLGAVPEQVIACDSISVNLTKVLCAALTMQSDRARKLVISQQDNFPTDLYMVQGLTALMGEHRCELMSVPEDDIMSSIEQYADQCAVLMLTHVNFRTGRILDMKSITELAHKHGILVIWDLAHSAGVLELALDECKVDFALGCTYKYLNGGPGAPAFVYAAKRHWRNIRQPISGWMGHKRPFDFTHDYEAGNGMQVFLAGTPPVISMSVLDAALDVFAPLSAKAIRQKSLSLGGFFQDAFDALLSQSEFALQSPKDVHQRGSQLAYSHPQSYAICQALIKNGVIADFRAPDILRIGFSPLFLSHQDLLKAVVTLQDIMQSKVYLEAEFQTRHAVT